MNNTVNTREAYKLHIALKSYAKKRGVEFSLTLGDYINLWEDSGKWTMRGRTSDSYRVVRVDSSKGFCCDNVTISKTSDHLKTVKRNAETKPRVRRVYYKWLDEEFSTLQAIAKAKNLSIGLVRDLIQRGVIKKYRRNDKMRRLFISPWGTYSNSSTLLYVIEKMERRKITYAGLMSRVRSKKKTEYSITTVKCADVLLGGV